MDPAIPQPPADAPPCRYDAFISYRHVEPDRAWAKWLHAALETYRVPGSIVRAMGVPARLSRVFRDEEELPASSDLNDQIEQALGASRFLIVICSPRTPQSRWVNREVERFRELGRDDRILALLIEGDPGDSFPRALCEIRRRVVDATGAAREQIEQVEPLAADVRPLRHESPRHLRRMARLRLLACILGVRFDDLRQREQERRARRLAYLGAAGFALSVAMGALAVAAIVQRNEAHRQRAAAVYQEGVANQNARAADAARRQAQRRLAESLIAQSDVYLSAARWDDAYRAIDDAFDAFTESGDSPDPATLAFWKLRVSAVTPLNSETAPSVFPGGALAVAPDGRTALALLPDRSPAIVDLPSGTVALRVDPEGGFMYDADFSHDGTRLVCAHEDGIVRLREAGTGRVVHRFGSHSGKALTVAYFPDAAQAVSGGTDGTLRVWDVPGRTSVGPLDRHHSPISAVATSARYMLSGDLSARVLLWDMRDKTVRPLEGASVPTLAAAVAPDGRHAAVLTPAGAIVWDLDSGEPTRFDNPRRETGAALDEQHPNGRTAFSSDSRRFLRRAGADAVVQPVDAGLPGLALTGHERGCVSMLFDRDGATVVTSGQDGRLRAFAPSTDALERRLDHRSNVYSVAVSRDGTLIVTGGGVTTTKLWDSSTGRLLREFETGPSRVIGVAIAPDSASIAAAGDDGAWVFDLDTGTTLRLTGHSGGVNAVAYSPDGSRLLTASKDATIKLWNLSDARERRAFQGHADNAIGVSWSPDGKRFASAGQDRAIILWDADGGHEVRRLVGHGARVRAVAFSPDGNRIASGSDDGTMRLWDAGDGRETLKVAADPSAVCSVAFSEDGQMIFTAGAANAVRVWDSTTGHEWSDIRRFSESVWSVAVGGGLCVAGSNDGTALVCDFPAAERLRRITEPVGPSTRPASALRQAEARARAGLRFAAQGAWSWAVEELEAARRDGADVPALLLARCHWLSGNHQSARAHVARTLQAAPADARYLKLCVEALERESKSSR